MAGQAAVPLQERIEQQVLRALQEKEAQLDAALQQQQQLQCSSGNTVGRTHLDEELEELREKRKRELQQQQQQLRDGLGHGTVTNVCDDKEFFAAAKESEKIVAAFYRASNQYFPVIEKRLRELAAKRPDIRCLHINAEKTPFLCDRLKIWCIPTIVLIRNGKTDHSIVGLDELGGSDFDVEDFDRVVSKWLGLH